MLNYDFFLLTDDFVCSKKLPRTSKLSKLWSKAPYHGTIYYFPNTITPKGNLLSMVVISIIKIIKIYQTTATICLQLLFFHRSNVIYWSKIRWTKISKGLGLSKWWKTHQHQGASLQGQIWRFTKTCRVSIEPWILVEGVKVASETIWKGLRTNPKYIQIKVAQFCN